MNKIILDGLEITPELAIQLLALSNAGLERKYNEEELNTLEKLADKYKD